MEILNKKDYHLYEEFLIKQKGSSFLQCNNWAKVKDQWKNEIVVSKNQKGEIIGGAMILIRKIPPFNVSLMYSPHGPCWDFKNKEILKDILKGVKELSKKYNGYLFKMDPFVYENDEEFIKNAKELGFSYDLSKQKGFQTYQPRVNYIIKFNGRSKDEIFANFHKKCRYNIRVAIKHGVECKVCGPDKIDDFYNILKVTAKRDGFIIRAKEYYVKMLESLGDYIKLYICYYEGKPISGAITTFFGERAVYVYGASDNNHRNVMPNYLMQWTMISDAIDMGCEIYDFMGIAGYDDENSKTYGIYRFKSSFTGEIAKYAGEFDLVLDKKKKALADISFFGLKCIKKVKKLLNR